MKTIHVMLAGLCLLCMSAVDVGASNDLKSVVKGKWEISIPEAPDGYRNYTLEIKEKNQAIVVDVKGGDINVKDQKFTEKDGKLSANLYVGEYVKVTIWEEGGIVKGTADTSMGKLTCNFKKATEKKE
ncbi:MAG: hypothetical protein LBT78_11360 [Tannerella sp.]|jgi:putative component of toxin-antitoxin plasmid stabilization module|nr:hypothetical protein [Tannerella sp.]